MPRLRFLVTMYECQRCGKRVRGQPGRSFVCVGHPPDPAVYETIQTVIGPRQKLVRAAGPERVEMTDIGPTNDPTVEPFWRQVWLAAA